MTTTTAHSTISTTNPTFTLQHQPTTTTKPTSTTPPPPRTSYNTSPSPIHPHPPSTTTTKSKLTPSNTQFEHLPFTFHFIPSHPNYISKLKLPTHIAKLCSDIQHSAELSIIKIIGVHLFKQNKHKKSKKSKNNKKLITSNQGFNPWNTLPLHLPILLQRLISPPPQNTIHQSSKPQPHSTPIQPSKPQARNIPYQPPKTTLPPIPSPNILH